jgi:hypothetical protein
MGNTRNVSPRRQDRQNENAEAPAERGRSLRNVAYITIAVGAAHAVLFLVSYWLLWHLPGPGAPDAQVVAFYRKGDQRYPILAGLYLMPFAGIAFIWFSAAWRVWTAEHWTRGNALLSNIQLVSSILYVALFFAAAAATAALPAGIEFDNVQISATLARLFPEIGSALLFVFAMRMAAMFVISTSGIARDVAAVPRWFIYLGYLVGLFLLLSATFSSLLVVVFPLWLLTLCALLLRRVRTIFPTDRRVLPGAARPETPSADKRASNATNSTDDDS